LGNQKDAAYYRARLARDFPAIKAALDRGEYRSVYAAALAAGLVRPTATFFTDNPADAARIILRHFQGERLAAFKRALDLLSQPPDAPARPRSREEDKP
jgi:hypothetical protein